MRKVKTSSPGMCKNSKRDMSGMSKSGMSDRGRPTFTDKTLLKTSTMTICLTPETHLELCELASEQNQKPAAMGRILIEAGIANKPS